MNGFRPLASTCLIATLALSSHAFSLELHVSPQGKDTNAGTAEHPLASIARAQQVVRQSSKRGSESITIMIDSGTYYLDDTIILTAGDSGSKDAPVIYQAGEGKQVVFSGGSDLNDLKWEEGPDSTFIAKVPAGFETDQLYVDGQSMPMARYPNYDPKAQYFGGVAADAFSKEKAAGWKDPKGGFMHAMHKSKWGGMHYEITGKDKNGELVFIGGWQNNRPSEPHKDIRFVENIYEELDAPGEWFLDQEASVLHFIPPAGVDLKKARLNGARLEKLVEFRGSEEKPVQFVSFRGITFSHTKRTFMTNKERMLRTDWTVNRSGAVLINGAENCRIEDCNLRLLGGNAVFVNNYNREITIRGCHLDQVGGNGIAFVGDPDAVRNGLVGYGSRTTFDKIDKTPGPKTNNYPADSLVEDCLIHDIGTVEKQTAGVEIDMAMHITVRHCSIYDVPRAGINIGDGCWGGHIIEWCDVFDTVMETGDHGSFNSWGRDRFWGLKGIDLNTVTLGDNKNLPLLDVIHPITIRNSRWRCDHGWDIDLDDGSSNYIIYNNLCLNGGIKNREGFYRTVENNIMVNNSLHPHVWYGNSQDVFRKNIVFESYRPAIMPEDEPWGKELDYNLYASETKTGPALPLAGQSKRDANSIFGKPNFKEPKTGDYRVEDDSPALKLGFKNFPMDQFGVKSPRLRKIARTPELPIPGDPKIKKSNRDRREGQWLGAKVRNIVGDGAVSAAGLHDEVGVQLLAVPENSPAAKAGLKRGDVILECDSKKTNCFADLQGLWHTANSGKVRLGVWRGQALVPLEIRK